MPNINELLVKSFAATGIHPLNKDRIMAKVSHAHAPQTDMVSPLVIEHLENLRTEANKKPDARVRAKRLLVSPGKSVSPQDVQASHCQAGPSRVARKLIPAKKRRARSPTPVSSDDSLSDIAPLESAEDEVVIEPMAGSDDEFKKGDYVLVRFASKSHVFHYVGILESQVFNDTWSTKYLRHKHDGTGDKLTFEEPNNPDVYDSNVEDFVKKLPKPTTVKNKLMFSASLFSGLVVR